MKLNLKLIIILSALIVAASGPLIAQQPEVKKEHNQHSLQILSSLVAAKTCEGHDERSAWINYPDLGWVNISCAMINKSGLLSVIGSELDVMLTIVDIRIALEMKEDDK